MTYLIFLSTIIKANNAIDIDDKKTPTKKATLIGKKPSEKKEKNATSTINSAGSHSTLGLHLKGCYLENSLTLKYSHKSSQQFPFP